MAHVIYLLRKPPRGSTTRALQDHQTGGINVEALRPQAGSWPPNVAVEHPAGCCEDECEVDCPVRALAEQAGRAAPGRFLVVGTPAPAPRPPWLR